MAKTKAEIQQEYNEALKVSQSLTGALNKMIDATEASQKKVSDAQKKYNDNLKSANSSATDYESTQEAISALEKQKTGLAKKYFGANVKLLPQKQKEVQANIDILKSEAERIKLVNKLDNAAQNLASSINGSLDGLLSGLDGIPIIGKGLSKLASGPINNLKSAFSDSAKIFTTKFSQATANGMGGMRAFAVASKSSMGSLMASLAGPQGVIAAIVAVLALGVLAFYNIEKAAKAFREETGLLNSQTKEMEGNINSVYQATVGLGASMEDVAKTAAAFTNEFGGIEQPAENTVKSMVVLNKNFGVAIQDAAKVNKVFQNMAGVSEEVAQRQSEIVVELSRQAGVAPRAVMADIADSAEDAGGFFRGNTQEMIRQSVAARAMGSSLKEVVNVSRQLLDYQSSIENEMEASAILQTNLNFSQARYLAANGDVVGAQQNMVKQLRSRVNLEKASVFEREAIAKATGMEFNQLLNLSRIQERFGDLKTEQLAAAQSLLKQGKDLSSLTKDDLAAETERLSNQEEMQGKLESMGNRMSAIGAKLLQAFLPIGEVLVSGLEGAVSVISFFGKIIQSVVSPAVKGLGFVMENAFTPIKWALSGIQKLIGFAKQYSDYIAVGAVTFGSIVAYQERSAILQAASIVQEGALNAVRFIGTQFTKEGYLYKMYEAAQTKIAAAQQIILNGYQLVANSIKKKGLLSAVAEMAMRAFSSLSAIPFIGPVLGAAAAIGAFALGKKYMSEAGDMSSPADGRTQISTKEGGLFQLSPNDDFAAAPDLLSNIGQNESNVKIDTSPRGVNISMDGVINELKELKQAFMVNKDVYIDNERITSRVSKTQEKLTTNNFGLMTT
jgi:hypothetical protein